MKYKYIYPSLLQSSNIKTNSWFDIKCTKNDAFNKRKKKRNINYNYVDTYKIILYPTDEQKNIINDWLNYCLLIYNLTNTYIKTIINDNNKKTVLNFYNLRKQLKPTITLLRESNNLNKHTADYTIKHCIEMFKSAISNCKSINKFNIRDLKFNKRRKNLVIEPISVSRKYNGIFIRELGEMKTSQPLNIITQNSILQYDSYKKTYVIITPKTTNKTVEVEQYKKCGVDIGVRTFMTVYSQANSYEIGTNTKNTIDRINNRLDKIRSSYNKKIINEKQFKNLYNKYSDKLINKISDMHNKTAKFLLTNYKTIVIEKVSIKQMVSNLTGNLHDITKRRLLALSHYKFKMKLKQMSVKYGTTIIETSAYLTSKNCHNCKTTNDKLNSNKLFICENCNLLMDRDINAAINIYKNRILTRSCPIKKGGIL